MRALQTRQRAEFRKKRGYIIKKQFVNRKILFCINQTFIFIIPQILWIQYNIHFSHFQHNFVCNTVYNRLYKYSICS